MLAQPSPHFILVFISFRRIFLTVPYIFCWLLKVPLISGYLRTSFSFLWWYLSASKASPLYWLTYYLLLFIVYSYTINYAITWVGGYSLEHYQLITRTSWTPPPPPPMHWEMVFGLILSKTPQWQWACEGIRNAITSRDNFAGRLPNRLLFCVLWCVFPWCSLSLGGGNVTGLLESSTSLSLVSACQLVVSLH